MTTQLLDRTTRRRPTRDDALALGARRKAARRRRTIRLRKSVIAIAVAAFVGPFLTIYQQMGAGQDPTLGSKAKVATALGTKAHPTASAPTHVAKARAPAAAS